MMVSSDEEKTKVKNEASMDMKVDAYVFYKKIERYIHENAMLAPGDGVVAGVSGGADSVCLLRILCALKKEYGLRLVVVHVHHGIRGADADEDEAFVRGECARLGVLFETVRVDVPALAADWGCSQEEAGRRVRYEVFCRAAAAHGFRKIAVAHNQNDNAETFLFQAFRGSGLWGLAGIAPCRAEGDFMIIRPLLGVERAQIEAYLEAEGAAYRTDTTNLTADYARNRIRNEILPLAQRSVNERAVVHLAETAAEMQELSAFHRELTLEGYRKVAQETAAMGGMEGKIAADARPGEISLDILAWEALPAFLQKEVVLYAIGRAAGSRRDIGRVHVQAVCGLMRGAVGKQAQLPYGLVANRTYGAVRIAQEKVPGAANGMAQLSEFPYFSNKDRIEISSFPMEFDLGAYELTLKRLEYGTTEFADAYSSFCLDGKQGQAGKNESKLVASMLPKYRRPAHGIHECKNEKNSLIPKNCYTKCFDYAKIRDTLVLRTRQTGDYVVIHSDGSRKSLKSLLIDQKVPGEYRDGLPLLAAGSSVLWAVGVRSGEGFYVTRNTKQILVAELRRKDRNCNGRED